MVPSLNIVKCLCTHLLLPDAPVLGVHLRVEAGHRGGLPLQLVEGELGLGLQLHHPQPQLLQLREAGHLPQPADSVDIVYR